MEQCYQTHGLLWTSDSTPFASSPSPPNFTKTTTKVPSPNHLLLNSLIPHHKWRSSVVLPHLLAAAHPLRTTLPLILLLTLLCPLRCQTSKSHMWEMVMTRYIEMEVYYSFTNSHLYLFLFHFCFLFCFLWQQASSRSYVGSDMISKQEHDAVLAEVCPSLFFNFYFLEVFVFIYFYLVLLVLYVPLFIAKLSRRWNYHGSTDSTTKQESF